jgi:hypothetical protein
LKNKYRGSLLPSRVRVLAAAAALAVCLVASPATAIPGCTLTFLYMTVDGPYCNSVECVTYITYYYQEDCTPGGAHGGGGGVPPPCPTTLSVSASSIDASDSWASINGQVESDGAVELTVTGPGASYQKAGSGVFTVPVNMTYLSGGTNTYVIAATATGPIPCQSLTQTLPVSIDATQTNQSSSGQGWSLLVYGNTIQWLAVYMTSYDVYRTVTAAPSGMNFPRIWAHSATARVSVGASVYQAQFAGATIDHSIGMDTAIMQSASGLPADTPWDQTFEVAQEGWWAPGVSAWTHLGTMIFPNVSTASAPNITCQAILQ